MSLFGHCLGDYFVLRSRLRQILKKLRAGSYQLPYCWKLVVLSPRRIWAAYLHVCYNPHPVLSRSTSLYIHGEQQLLQGSERKLRRERSAEQTKAPIAAVSLGAATSTCFPLPLSIQIPLTLNCHLCFLGGMTKSFILRGLSLW